AFNRGGASSRAASILSVSSDARPSHAAAFWRIREYGGGSGSGQTSASHCSLIFARPASGMMRVTKTFGLAAMDGLRCFSLMVCLREPARRVGREVGQDHVRA